MNKYILPILVITIAVVFVAKLLSLQVMSFNYLKKSENNAVLTVYDYPERGFIYDRNGVLMASNDLYYDLMVIIENTKSFDTLEFCKIAGISKKRLKERLSKATSFSKKLPYLIESHISKNTYAFLQESMWKFPGFFTQKKLLRKYNTPVAANVMGYVSEVNLNDLKKDRYYRLGELIGRQGIEKSYEKYLRGIRGEKYYQKDKFNRIIAPYKKGKFDISPNKAKDIYLTIDIKLQSYGKKIMKNKRGSIVAIEPKTGEVLALVSSPSFDPNLLVGRKRNENYKKLVSDTISKPLFDRATQAIYPPGSPFKIINGLIFLQEKIISPKTVFFCQKGYYYSPNQLMKCHCGRTKNNFLEAIYYSCNSYFAQSYARLINKNKTSAEGLNIWNKYVKSFGLGNYLGYDLPSGKKGYVPDSSYYNNIYKKWKAATIISNSIGQGEVLVTPIQLANFITSIANRGYYYVPHFVKRISETSDSLKFLKKEIPINSEYFDIVIEGMHQVVEKGTARVAKIKGIDVCGKTGTAENFIRKDGKKTQLTDHSIFIAFAPKEDPKIAIAVFIENGYWGARWAAPIASLMIEKHLNKNISGASRKWLENKMITQGLEEEYKKIYTKKPFKINE